MKRKSMMSLTCLLAMGLLASCGNESGDEGGVEGGNEEVVNGKNYAERAFGMKLEMVYVKGGTFEMGATAEQASEADEDEYPVRTVWMDSYYIGKYEVTQGQWRAVMGRDVDDYDYGKGDDYPVYHITWRDAREFCRRLTEQTGKIYLLPTEAMWEYAARGGVHKTRTRYAGSNNINEVAWYYNNSCDTLDRTDPNYGTHPVGLKKANALGLHDMSGNVGEYCADRYYWKYDPEDDHNPQGSASATGDDRVGRGGEWRDRAGYCRVSTRYDCAPDYDYGFGFRVAALL